jgi:translation initiation factor 2 beta subunit (eIF-2beta)/eIF-5
MEFQLSFVVAPDEMLKTADEILRARISCLAVIRRDIRALAKAYIDEADELKRSAREVQSGAARTHIQSLSPPKMIENAKSLRNVDLSSQSLQQKVRKVAESYVLIAEQNQRLFGEFKARYRAQLPPMP